MRFGAPWKERGNRAVVRTMSVSDAPDMSVDTLPGEPPSLPSAGRAPSAKGKGGSGKPRGVWERARALNIGCCERLIRLIP